MTRLKRGRLLGVLLTLMAAGMLTIVVVASGWSSNGLADRDAASGKDTDDRVRVLPVLTIRLGELTAPARVDDYRGVLQPSKSAELAFRGSGKIKEILVEEGSEVAAGEVLATLESADIRASLEVTEARIREAQATLAELESGPRAEVIAASEAEVRRLEALVELAQATALREKQLQETKASSAQAYDNARFNTQQQIASLEAAKQQWRELKAGTRSEQIAAQRARVAALEAERKRQVVDLEDASIIAPFPGVISRRYVDEGSIAGPQTLVLRLLMIDPMEAKFGLTPDDAATLYIGQELPISVGKLEFRGFVSTIEPEVDLETRTQAVTLAIPRKAGHSQASDARLSIETRVISEASQPSNYLVAGRTVSLSLGNQQTGSQDFFWVPLTSLSKSTRGLWSVLVVDQVENAGYQVVRRDVQVGQTDTKLAQITGGMINSGDLVIADGTHRVSPGMFVEPIFASPSASGGKEQQ